MSTKTPLYLTPVSSYGVTSGSSSFVNPNPVDVRAGGIAYSNVNRTTDNFAASGIFDLSGTLSINQGSGGVVPSFLGSQLRLSAAPGSNGGMGCNYAGVLGSFSEFTFTTSVYNMAASEQLLYIGGDQTIGTPAQHAKASIYTSAPYGLLFRCQNAAGSFNSVTLANIPLAPSKDYVLGNEWTWLAVVGEDVSGDLVFSTYMNGILINSGVTLAAANRPVDIASPIFWVGENAYETGTCPPTVECVMYAPRAFSAVEIAREYRNYTGRPAQ